MWMIEYSCEIDLDAVETVIPGYLQEHITILDLKFMRDKKILNFVQRFYTNSKWHHRYFAHTKKLAYSHVEERHLNEAWKYFYAYLKTKDIQIIGPNIQEIEISDFDEGVKYYF